MAIYFVDSKSGNNSNDGKSPEKAFASFEKINEMTFSAGDKILLKRGSVFTDHVCINGSGEQYNPIELSCYGDDVEYPAIHTADDSNYSVLVTGEYVEINSIEVSNVKGHIGIFLKSELHGATRGVTVSRCYIHDVWTENDLGPRYSKKSWPHDYGGISVETNRDEPTWYEELRIEHNRIENVNRTGIWLGGQWCNRFRNTLNWMANRAPSMDDPWYPHKDVYISWNTVDHAHGDGIVAMGCVNLLMEYNRVYYANCMSRIGNSNVALWNMACTGALIQYNEVAFTRHEYGGDGEAFDVDQCNIDTVYQYNYSHDNEGGFFLVCNGCNDQESLHDIIIRNNLSVNDACKRDNPIFTISSVMRNVQFLNNTVCVTHKNRFRLLQVVDYMNLGLARDVLFANNLFYSENTDNWHNFEAAGQFTFDANLFYNVRRLPVRENIIDNNIYDENPVLMGEVTVPATKLETAAFVPFWCSPLTRMGKYYPNCADRDFNGLNTQGCTYIGAFYHQDLNIGL